MPLSYWFYNWFVFFQKLSVQIDENALHEILNEVDLNKNGQVELDEFLQVWTAIHRLQVVLVPLCFSGRICSCRCENLKIKSACYLHVSTSMFCHKPTASQWLVPLKYHTYVRMSIK